MSFYFILGTVSFFTMTLGIIKRHRIPLHIYLVGSAIAIDLFVVLSLEFERDAIGKMASGTLSLPQQCHALISTLVVLLYIPLVTTGILRFLQRKSTPRPSVILWHRRLGFVTYVLRSIAFIFMFSMYER